MRFFGRGRRRVQERHDKLAAGEAVDVPCQIRRTSSRGWGPWVVGELALPATGPASFVAADPLKRSLVSGRAGGSGPVPVEGPGALARRAVRFRGEAFYGIDGEVIVLTTERNVTELATEPDDTELIATRLSALGFDQP
ncbi:MAG: hypothetical protein JO291_15895 [Acidimicrobiia bacterium]|nr:hypothetical protein [Acidimicrobiia bacterium]